MVSFLKKTVFRVMKTRLKHWQEAINAVAKTDADGLNEWYLSMYVEALVGGATLFGVLLWVVLW